MYQSFETPSHDQGAARLAALRDELSRRGLAGFIVPRADAHQGENVPARDERLRWLTGFTGSAGLSIALADKAAVFVDGRYTLQVREQIDGSAFEAVGIEKTSPEDWLAQSAKGVIGYDPWLLTDSQRSRFETAAEKAGASLRAEETNPIDAVWEDQPPAPMGSVKIHPLDFAGIASSDKRAEAATAIRDAGFDAFVLTLPDSINWLLNIRGGDVAHTPVALAFAILNCNGSVDLFIDEEKVEAALRAHLGDEVRVHPPDRLIPMLREFAIEGGGFQKRKVGAERSTAPVAIRAALDDAGAEADWHDDPCTLPKARKNAAEREGARKAHLRDGAAFARFLCWFDGAVGDGLDEIAVAERLVEFRDETGKLEDISFDTISGHGPHGAMPHYRVSRETNLPITEGSLYLIDSGGQYKDGTTDITRTMAVGTPRDDHRRAFTLVLRGMIEVSTLRFPNGTKGVQIDAIARAAMWRAGIDFDHGLGHGVGAYLGVHEGPANLSKRGTVALEPGMILSNEPGYYKEGDFGIRTENLLLVTESSTPNGGEREMMGFDTLTLAPIDLRLIDPSLLSPEHIAWLNAYHARVYEELYPLLDDETREWLEGTTEAVEAG